MGLLIDTNVLIRMERRREAVSFQRWRAYGDAYISTITVSELLVGVHRANDEHRRSRRSAYVERVLASIPALDFTTTCARVHAEVFATLASGGKLIGPHDLIIAATALSHGFAVLTANEREFSRVPGLIVESFPGDP